MRQTERLALYGTLNGSLVGVPAYSLQRVQSCVTESKLLLCLSLQRGYVDILPRATKGIQHNERWRFQRFSPDRWLTAVCVPVASKSQWVSLGVCVGVEVILCVEIFLLTKSVRHKDGNCTTT